MEQLPFLLEGAIAAVIALEELFAFPSEKSVQPIFVKVFEVESHTALYEVADVKGREVSVSNSNWPFFAFQNFCSRSRQWYSRIPAFMF
jgi:hypothetical protein